MGETMPDWLFSWACKAIIGEVYPSIRAIAIGYNNKRRLIVRYYVDRPPQSEDYDSIEVVVTNILANTQSSEEIVSVSEEVEFTKEPLGRLDVLGGLIYARREFSES